MNTIHAPQRSAAPPDIQPHLRPHAHSTFGDRLAMRIGLRLILWSQRPRPSLDHDHERARARDAARADREEARLAAARSMRPLL